MIWAQSVVNRTPDGPSFDSATSATASQAVLVAQITKLAPTRSGFDPSQRMGSRGRAWRWGATANKTRLPKKGRAKSTNGKSEIGATLDHSPLRYPPQRARRDENGLTDWRTGETAKFPPTKARSDRGAQGAGVNPSSSGGSSSSSSSSGQGAGPPVSNSHIHIAPKPCNFQHQSILNLASPCLS